MQAKKKNGTLRKHRDPRVIIEDAKYCPFALHYVRDVDEKTGMPYTPFKLLRYNLVHSHPLCLEYQRIL